jgi:predicted phage tail protein
MRAAGYEKVGRSHSRLFNATFEAFTAVTIQVEVFWAVMQYSAAIENQCFRGLCCLYL